MFQLNEKWHSVEETLYFEDLFTYKTIKTTKQITYYNDVLAFDIEASSFKDFNDEDYFEVTDEAVYNYLLGTKIKTTDKLIKEFPDFNSTRKSLFGRLFFSNKSGIAPDSLYHDLTSQFPYYFPDDIINPADQLERIIDVFNENRPIVADDFADKRSLMYVWQIAINGTVIIGRTWDQFVDLLESISKEFSLNEDRRMIIYVHSLAYEFEFMKDIFTWTKVFAANTRKPIYALNSLGFEFRCSYILSNLSLANVGKSLTKYKVEKLDGKEFNYELVRHFDTPLSDLEYSYCVHDVLVVSAFIKEEMEKHYNDNITKLPLTATGVCRNYVRNMCLNGHGRKAKSEQFEYYHKSMKQMTIRDEAEYRQLERAFTGGFTHGNVNHIGRILTDVDSFDFTSSYPAVLCSERFPMSRSRIVKVHSYEELKEYCKKYCCLFDIRFYHLQSTYINENYISLSKCYDMQWRHFKDKTAKEYGIVTNNGRVVCCGKDKCLTLTLTEVDMEIIEHVYTWDKISIGTFRVYMRDFLPKEIVMSCLTLYKNKTELKDVKGQEDFYTKSKQLLNSIYGMMVTSIVKPTYSYNGTAWVPDVPDIAKELKKYNNSKKRFLFYPWGVWTVKYATKNLWTGILAFGDDYCYSDTDSIKAVNASLHMDYIRKYNNLIEKKLRRVSEHYNIPFDMFAPKTIKGEVKMLGVWDQETEKTVDQEGNEHGGSWLRFKSLGAKRYMILTRDNDLTLTVSGVNKKAAIPYMLDRYGKEGSFDAFTEDLTIPGDYTGKLTHYYLDEPMSGEVTDYLGNTVHYTAKSGIYMEKASYSFSMQKSFIEYIRQVQERRTA